MCGQNRGCNAISGCTDPTFAPRHQMTEEVSLKSVIDDTPATVERTGKTWFWIATAICASAIGGIYLGRMKGQNKNNLSSPENSYQKI